MIQAQVKGFITRNEFKRKAATRKDRAVLKIQSRFRAYLARRDFLRKKNAIMKC